MNICENEYKKINNKITMKKIIITISFFILSFFLISIALKNNHLNNNIIKKYIPIEIKEFFKKNIFILNYKNEEIKVRDKAISNNSKNFLKFLQNTINKEQKYSFDFALLPIDNYYLSGSKPLAYIEQTNNEIIIASGSGNFFFFEKKELDNFNEPKEKINPNTTETIT